MMIPIPPLAMLAVLHSFGIPRHEMNQFATYLEQLPDSESPQGKLADLDVWFERHIQLFRRSGNPLFAKQQ